MLGLDSGPEADSANVSARESAGNKVDWFKIGSSDVLDVSITSHVGPVLPEDSVTEAAVLDLPAYLETGAL